MLDYAHGARSMTHVYNGMTPFKHCDNGLVGAAYRLRTMYGEIICDGNHSTPAALNNYFMSKGPDYSIMVSDALMAKGSPAGSKYIFGGNEIIICLLYTSPRLRREFARQTGCVFLAHSPIP